MLDPVSALKGIRACDVADTLQRLGVPDGGYLPGIHMRSPSSTKEVVIIGPAYTVMVSRSVNIYQSTAVDAILF
jgi:hypothetical protein